MQSSSKNFVTRLKARRTRALIVGLLPPPPCVEGPAPALVIVVDGVGVGTASQALVVEK
jgi:hypothetical protein